MKLYMTFLEEPNPFKTDKVNGVYTSSYPRPIYVGTKWMELVDKMGDAFEAGTEYYIGEVCANDYTICGWLEDSFIGKEIFLNPARTEVVSFVKMKVL